MQTLYTRIEAAARTRGTVLEIGDSGTGKELVARAIHAASSRAAAPFVALNCAALPRELIESELFGYQRGAFSGACSDSIGLFRAAESGTLFLDEITEMPAAAQAKLLRALQERTVRPVGSTREIPCDVRIIASTNRDPGSALRAGQLRSDLYYRVHVNVIHVPPLREHIEDLPLLVEHILAVLAQRLEVEVPAIEEEAMRALTSYSWPGNVRELMGVLEAALTFGRGDLIRVEDLPLQIAEAPPAPTRGWQDAERLPTLAELERDLIARALAVSGGNKCRAAQLLGISRKRLYAKLTKYGRNGC